jgi:hypothetical protein
MILILSLNYTHSRELAERLGIVNWRHIDGAGSLVCNCTNVVLVDGSAVQRHDLKKIEQEAATRRIPTLDEPEYLEMLARSIDV